MGDETKTEMKGSVDIQCANDPGSILVEIVRHLFSKGATVLATTLLERIFSGKMAIEDIIFAIDARGLKVKIGAVVEICGRTSDKGEIDPPIVLAVAEENIQVPPGMLQSFEVEPDGGIVH